MVDDEPAGAAAAARILRQNGYATLEAGTYEEALSLADTRDLQLLLTDSVMPHMSGQSWPNASPGSGPGCPSST